jgi:small subunit ribosomal protein S9
MVLSSDPYVWGTGRRKTSVARVRIKAGTGQFHVNGRPVDEYFGNEDMRLTAAQPLITTETRSSYDVWVLVSGGGPRGQADAVKLGVARALKLDNPNFDPVLREHHLLTRDPRRVERKKYGLRKARRATQFSKR